MTIIGSTKFDYISIEGVLGIRTRDRRMVGADESTELQGFPSATWFVPTIHKVVSSIRKLSFYQCYVWTTR